MEIKTLCKIPKICFETIINSHFKTVENTLFAEGKKIRLGYDRNGLVKKGMDFFNENSFNDLETLLIISSTTEDFPVIHHRFHAVWNNAWFNCDEMF